MASTTNAKKEVIDYLWDWADGHGDWAKLLLEKLLSSGSRLTTTERDLVFKYFLQSIKLHSGLALLKITKPTYTPQNKSVKISALSEITGVNCLAQNQTIAFSENITVVYGENGTGKTGYGRILKALGFSYETSGNIYNNVFKGKEVQSAKIEYEANGVKKSFTWDGSNRNSDLDGISVFNSHCVAISLADRQLVVTPIGFELFNLVIEELGELNNLANLEKQKYAIADFAPLFTSGTPQYLFVNSLSKNSSSTLLADLSTFDESHLADLLKKQKEMQGLNTVLIESTIKSLRLQIGEIDTIIGKINRSKATLNAISWHELIGYNAEIEKLQNQTQKGLKEIVEPFNIQFYQSQEFSQFLASAENYIRLLDNENYPGKEDTCIYCRQSLDGKANELIHSYRSLLNDTTQTRLATVQSSKNHFKAQISQLDNGILVAHPTFGTEDNGKSAQPVELIELNKKLSQLKINANEPRVTAEMFDINYDEYLNFFETKKTKLSATLETQQTTLNSLSFREIQLKREINELRDRKLLAEKSGEILKTVDNYKKAGILNDNINSFNTRSISLKTSEAREDLVKHNFNSIFKSELDALRKSHLVIELNFATNRGMSQVLQKVRSHNLTEILSEGEQKAISLAEFLTELQLDNSLSPVVFDDPVNSLDHHLIDDYARRAIKLSQNRQVIIFTHSVLLFNSLYYFSNQPSYKAITFAFFQTNNNHGETGFVSKAEEINKVSPYIAKINVLLNGPKSRPENDMAREGYGYLRTAIELCVEQEIFLATIKRYQKNVALSLFVKVDGIKLDKVKDQLNEIFERSSGFITGHSNPEEISSEPTLQDLKRDIELFKDIRNVFVK